MRGTSDIDDLLLVSGTAVRLQVPKRALVRLAVAWQNPKMASSRIRRDGVEIGSSSPQKPVETLQLPIAELVPLEGAVVEATVQNYRVEIVNGRQPEPVRVVQIAGSWLVVDGNHRVEAARLEGLTTVEARVSDPSGNPRFYESSLRHARRRGRIGFAGLTTVATEDERKEFTSREATEDEEADFLAELAKRIP